MFLIEKISTITTEPSETEIIITEELEASLTLAQNEKLYSLYISIITKLLAELTRSKLGVHSIRSVEDTETEINKYKLLVEEVADQILKQRRLQT
jgi:hypothetical protein